MLTLQDASHDSHDSDGAQILPFPTFFVPLHARPFWPQWGPWTSHRFGATTSSVAGRRQAARHGENFDQQDWTETVGFMWDWRWKMIKYGNGSKPLITIFGRINSHKPSIVGYLGYQGFDSFPYDQMMGLAC